MRDRGPVVKHRSHNKLTGNTKIIFSFFIIQFITILMIHNYSIIINDYYY